MAKRFNNSKRRLEQEPASLCIRYPVVSLWEGITMRVIAGSIPPVVIDKEDQILPAFQIVTKSR